jgi:hypothetical protein
VNRWKEAGMPWLMSVEEKGKALSFLNRCGLKNLNVNEVQLWLTIVRDGAFAKYRGLFPRTGLGLASMTKPNLLRIHKVGAELFKAIQQKPTNEK